MIKRVFTATSKDGKLKMDDREAFEEYLRYELPGGKVEVIVRKPKDQRTIPQNRYYWGVVVQRIADETGMTREEVHKLLKYKFLSLVADVPSGEEYLYIRSTTDLSISEWEDYMRKCREYASTEVGIFIPKPNEFEL